ncbi:pseudouridine synthase [Desulfitispora alkaliphila]|uniref:pseudouridine synthase n=1 Tax=Desulfitispora alkaliphila TaxID=622674 RepID=UPI003D1DA361
MERLQKYMAQCGVGSRRKCEEYIEAGSVKVNGEVVRELGTKIDPETDIVEYQGRVIKQEENKVYILLNKPPKYITTVQDEMDRPKVMDLLTDVQERVFPVGRLDWGTEGLLLLTNDGELAHILTHPSFKVEKEYHALVPGKVDDHQLEQLRTGIMLDDGITHPAKVKRLKTEGKKTWLAISIHEGRNRQVRRMCAAIGHPVIQLKRVRLGGLTGDKLKVGEYKFLTEEEINLLLGKGGYKKEK